MKAVVITVGSRKESLGAMKLANWLRRLGNEVEETNQLTIFHSGFDLYAFSCVFSWKLSELVMMAKVAKAHGEVWIGGPAVSFHPDNAAYVQRETGIAPHVGIDERFEEEPGAYSMVYFSRGCPAYTPACGSCPVPRLEGKAFRLYPNAVPAQFLLDNNLSALPDEYQDHIINRYKTDYSSRKRVDANSGFEPHTFTEKTLLRWQDFPMQCWRFGYDDITERDQAREMMTLLQRYGYKGDKVRVYTLIGNEPKAICVQRMNEVISFGFHPWPQRLRPLNWLGGSLPTFHDWSEPDLIAYQRYYSIAAFWKGYKPDEWYYQGRYPLLG